MTGGLIQLVAYGYDDMYLTNDPQVTYFKVVYRRHSNFSAEQIPQYFINPPNFGKKSTCIISKNADLAGSILIVVTLPKIRPFTDDRVKFAWVKRVGFALIKSVEIEINGRVIDRHYGEWLNLWAELTGEINGAHERGTKKMIGDVPELTDFTNSKDQYTLYIPLKFWFCKNSGLALPLVSLQYSDVKINVEFEEAEKCFFLTPTHYIKCRDDIVNFEQFEYIEQNIDGEINAGIFIDYDSNSKRLYYYKVTSGKLTSIPVSSSFDTSTTNIIEINKLLASPTGLKYSITGKSSGYSTFAEFNNNTLIYSPPKIRNLNFKDCFLLIDYYFLDDDERLKFSQAKHDYLIEQLFFTPDIEIDNGNYNAKIIAEHPCKLIVWVVQMKYVRDAKDYYNYTDSYQNKIFGWENYKNKKGTPIGKSLIKTETILMNGNERISARSALYFDSIQKHLHTKHSTLPGINMYSFGLNPFSIQPMGACNMSQVDNPKIKLSLSSIINIKNHALFRGYCLCNNVFRIVNGLAGLVFTR